MSTIQALIDQWRLHPSHEVGSCANQLAGWLREQITATIQEGRCPHCHEGVNSSDHGGNERCFHCDRCSYIGCMWTHDEKRKMLVEITNGAY